MADMSDARTRFRSSWRISELPFVEAMQSSEIMENAIRVTSPPTWSKRGISSARNASIACSYGQKMEIHEIEYVQYAKSNYEGGRTLASVVD
jgi:hypothetical protein